MTAHAPQRMRLHPQVIKLTWNRFREAKVDLFASHEFYLCQLYYSLTEAPLGIYALTHS
ncbi:hypothetical protein H4Q32_016661 [Labeo rohita]|uniref:Uncharacterized protein n=1 Tax=Labeo rohita TaxID=84645 RepID=A0ABQ8M6P8_LABRO|nr:hypothetical protein H4Q32_016661 [Labeo rohita]